MRAITWQGRGHVALTEAADPKLEAPDDIIIRLTSTAICGSDLHLYGPLTPFMSPGDVLGHEGMGRVLEAGPAVQHLNVGDRVVVPFNISCGECRQCVRGLTSQCEVTQVRAQGSGAALLGYSRLYGQVPGAQAELMRVPKANFGPVKVPETHDDDRWLFLSDILPTAWQAVTYAGLEPDQTIVVLGLGPVGQLITRCARLRGAGRIIAVDPIPERLALARRAGCEVVDAFSPGAELMIADLTEGRGPDCVVDAVGMEAYGSPFARAAVGVVSALPRRLAAGISKVAGIDRLAAFQTAVRVVGRGGTISLAGVYGGSLDPVNLRLLFDKQITLRMGQANVRNWTDELLTHLGGDIEPFGVDALATHHLPLEEAPEAYRHLRDRDPGWLKVVLNP